MLDQAQDDPSDPWSGWWPVTPEEVPVAVYGPSSSVDDMKRIPVGPPVDYGTGPLASQSIASAYVEDEPQFSALSHLRTPKRRVIEPEQEFAMRAAGACYSCAPTRVHYGVDMIWELQPQAGRPNVSEANTDWPQPRPTYPVPFRAGKVFTDPWSAFAASSSSATHGAPRSLNGAWAKPSCWSPRPEPNPLPNQNSLQSLLPLEDGVDMFRDRVPGLNSTHSTVYPGLIEFAPSLFRPFQAVAPRKPFIKRHRWGDHQDHVEAHYTPANSPEDDSRPMTRINMNLLVSPDWPDSLISAKIADLLGHHTKPAPVNQCRLFWTPHGRVGYARGLLARSSPQELPLPPLLLLFSALNTQMLSDLRAGLITHALSFLKTCFDSNWLLANRAQRQDAEDDNERTWIPSLVEAAYNWIRCRCDLQSSWFQQTMELSHV